MENSTRATKRFVLIMGPTMKYHFGSANGKTYIDHHDSIMKRGWIARHKKDKNWNNKNSGIYHSRHLLWTENTLPMAIKKYETTHKVRINVHESVVIPA